MKRILSLLAVLAFSAVLSAPLLAQANPFLGTWKLNVAQSTFSGPAPKSLTRTVVAAGKSVRYTFKVVDADGNSLEYGFATDYDGKYDAVTGTGMPGGADSIATKRVGSNKTQSILKKGTIQIATAQAEVSKDGKVCTVTIKGTVDEKDFASKSVYDKQ
jgi:hypothetical protein